MASIVDAVGPQHAERMLELLIRIKVGCTGNYMPEAWSTLLALAPSPEVRLEWIIRMAEFAPAILDDLSDLQLWLKGEDLDAMFQFLEDDIVPIQLLHQASALPGGLKSRRMVGLTIATLKRRFEDIAPRVSGTCTRVRDDLRAMNIGDPELLKLIEDRRLAILAERMRMKADCEVPEEPLEAWIRP